MDDSEDEVWKGFVSALDAWQDAYKKWQESGTRVMESYSKAIQNTPGYDQMARYNELWMRYWKECGMGSFDAFSRYWQKQEPRSPDTPTEKKENEWEKRE